MQKNSLFLESLMKKTEQDYEQRLSSVQKQVKKDTIKIKIQDTR